MKQGDYVVFKKGTGLAGSVAKVVTQEQQILRRKSSQKNGYLTAFQVFSLPRHYFFVKTPH